MKNKCAYCFTHLDPAPAVCRVCKIDPLKEKSALTREERKKGDRCRTLYTVGFLSIVGGFMGLFLTLPSIFFYLRGQQSRNLATPTAFLPYYVVSMTVLNVLLPFFGLALRRYKKWCYRGGIALYAAFFLLNIPGFHPFPILITPFFVYWIASPPSRDILVF